MNMHLRPADELLHETCFSQNYPSAPHYPQNSGHAQMEHQQHYAAPQMFRGVPLPLYCPSPAQELMISRHTTQQPSNTHYLPYSDVNEPHYRYNPPQQFRSQLPTAFPPGQHARGQVYFPQPFIYGGDVLEFAEPSSMYGTFSDTAENHKYPPPQAPHPFPGTQITLQHLSPGITSTPVLYRMSAMRPPGDKSLISAGQLEACLQKDLDGNVVVTAPHFFLELFWPTNMSPLPVDQSIFPTLVKNQVWDSVHNRFTLGPASYSEVDMAKWLNALGGMLGVFTTGAKRLRVWCPRSANKSPGGLTINRKPDLTLLDKSDTSGHISWTMIHALAEVTSESKFPKRMISTINDKSYLLFLSQHDRRFAPALCFDGKGMFSLTITDRQGQISMPPISLLHGKGNALILMKILAFLMYGDLHFTGRDPTMILDSSKAVKAIIVNGHAYEVVRIIYTLQSLIGRGTTIWLVFRDGSFYILKDSWIQASHVESEIFLLEKLKHDEKLKNHVPHIVEGEDVKVMGVVDSTGRYRELVGGTEEERIHRRIVMEPIGIPITKFESKAGFILGIIDIVVVLDHLCKQYNMLHRDISPNNLMLVRQGTAEQWGLLIDFDYGALFNDNRTISPGFRTGTPPFMAIDLMLSKEEHFRHELRHDLESILYVILWVCTSMDGVGAERREADPHFMEVPLRTWFDRDANIRDLGYRKLAHIVDSERAILDNFSPFWKSFKPFVRKLLHAFFPIHPIAGCPITPDEIISILKVAAERVDIVADDTDQATTPYDHDAGATTFNQILYDSASHSYLNQVKRAREEETSPHQRSKKGKTNVINFQNWSSSMDGKASLGR